MSSVAPLFRALASPKRRRILDLLRKKPMTTGQLADKSKESRFSVMQHLAVLVDAGLVLPRKRGRERWNYLNAVPLQQMYERWVRPYEESWATGLVSLKGNMEKEQRMTEVCNVVDVELEIAIEAPLRQVWATLLEDTAQWWPRDFYVSPQAKSLNIEARVGGRMFEDWGKDRGVLWGTVIVLDPPSTLELLCHITPRFGGPRMSMLRLSLAERDGTTILAVSDATMGRVDAKTAHHLDEGWRGIFEGGLKAWMTPSS